VTRKERFQFVIEYFKHFRPEAETELNFENPYQLLVAVILSAQCTDKRVNITTPAFFKKYPTIDRLADAHYEDVFELIKSISFPGNKSRHLIGMAQMVKEKFRGQIPMIVEVDTHVFRVSARIGLTVGAKTPLATELQLLKYVPRELVSIFHHWLILHGRYICIARKPRCGECGLKPVCAYFQRLSKDEKRKWAN
jgi:endonuclease-3